MRILGTKASLQVIRWDVVYLLANLMGDERAGVAALAAPIEALLAELKSERDEFEQAENVVVVMTARKGKRDGKLDAVVIKFGGVVRATDKALYGILFSKYNPSQTTRLALDNEVAELERILGEFKVLPADHAVRTAYEAETTDALSALKEAMKESNQADTGLALARTRLDRFKIKVDQARIETHGKLLTLLKNKVDADAFFRPTTSAPGPKAEEGGGGEEPAPAEGG
jgi:hypothetical protein